MDARFFDLERGCSSVYKCDWQRVNTLCPRLESNEIGAKLTQKRSLQHQPRQMLKPHGSRVDAPSPAPRVLISGVSEQHHSPKSTSNGTSTPTIINEALHQDRTLRQSFAVPECFLPLQMMRQRRTLPQPSFSLTISRSRSVAS